MRPASIECWLREWVREGRCWRGPSRYKGVVMDCMVIQGGRRLAGEVSISGAKNAALPILASTLLSKGACALSNVPDVRDVLTMSKVLTHLGAGIEVHGDRYTVTLAGVASCQAPYELVKTMR